MDEVFNLGANYMMLKKCISLIYRNVMLKGHDWFFDKFDHKVVNCFYFVFKYS